MKVEAETGVLRPQAEEPQPRSPSSHQKLKKGEEQTLPWSLPPERVRGY